ncbi:hypothetical protein SFRURICE_020697 [Spodoptera frugiperda]|nr:hypothetical protein SFRURICE_020697 [Spodoptera frugiperda]
MEGLVNLLKELQNVIHRGLTNLKKSPKERLSVDYIQTRRELLERDWNLFVTNYTKLHEQYETQGIKMLSELYDSTEDTYITYTFNCILKRLFGLKRMHVESAISLKELLDTTNDCLNGLKNLKVDVTTWDVIIIHIVTFKLDSETRKQWNRFRALEFIEPKRNLQNQNNNSHVAKSMVVSSSSIRCEYCNESHKLCFCKRFAKEPLEERRNFVAQHNICFNCLGGNHTVINCKKPTTCKLCHKRHHSLLHPNLDGTNKRDTASKPTVVEASPSTSSAPVVSCISTNTVPVPGQVLLATALVKAESKTGNYQIVRALLDQGSQACFVTEDTVQFLRLKKIPIHGMVSGLGQKSTIAKYMVNITIQSRFKDKC